MIKYGDDRSRELRFAAFFPHAEKRDDNWVDVELRFTTESATPVPDDLIDLTALVVCTTDGDPIQIIPLDAGCDCEYQFTFFEKEQIAAYVRGKEVQQAIAEAVRQG
ncbi:hypothetical protein [Cohnella zeiphila]|uniref:Uncharacterized protein n=1 Tax=Cohnella zeiphila TaxID=2761120 RepID=A0A7X0SK76_9BACL|nr:hypothetical protein [Cohnella zeiphila]MBB6730319.1 hypothetical protein [Cohnella zeiphila]